MDSSVHVRSLSIPPQGISDKQAKSPNSDLRQSGDVENQVAFLRSIRIQDLYPDWPIEDQAPRNKGKYSLNDQMLKGKLF